MQEVAEVWVKRVRHDEKSALAEGAPGGRHAKKPSGGGYGNEGPPLHFEGVRHCVCVTGGGVYGRSATPPRGPPRVKERVRHTVEGVRHGVLKIRWRMSARWHAPACVNELWLSRVSPGGAGNGAKPFCRMDHGGTNPVSDRIFL